MSWVLSAYFTPEETEAQDINSLEVSQWSEADLDATVEVLIPEPLH